MFRKLAIFWWNATGPNKPSVTPVDAWTFLMLCRTRFPRAIISIGWTTQVDDMSMKLGYSREMIDQMASLVKEYSLLQPVTFPVNGSLLKFSIGELQRLLFQVTLFLFFLFSLCFSWKKLDFLCGLTLITIWLKSWYFNRFQTVPWPFGAIQRIHYQRRICSCLGKHLHLIKWCMMCLRI